jgi:hypothetical protein
MDGFPSLAQGSLALSGLWSGASGTAASGREVATKRVSAKKTAAEKPLKDLFKKNEGQLNAALRLERTSRRTDISESDSHQLLLSTGELISAGRGRVIENWPVLDECCCIRPRPEGGFVGVSKAGMIGVWEAEL